MKRKPLILWTLSLSLCVLLGFEFHARVHFDWHLFGLQMRRVEASRIVFATALVYVSVVLRGFRWATLLKPVKRVHGALLIGPQFIGFTCVALFGSIGDLARPYLVARTSRLPVSSQIATYTIERMFDLSAAALIFAFALLSTPKGADEKHRAVFVHVGVASGVAVMAIVVMALSIRSFGEVLAGWAERGLGRVAPAVGEGVAAKIRSFRDGLYTIGSIGDFVTLLMLSLTIWGLIAAAYVQVAHAFPDVPQLARMGFSETMLLVAASIGGSLVQLPVVGWFTQIGATAATMHAVLGVPTEAATACGALFLAVTFLFLIPGGLVFAQVTRVSIRSAIEASETI